MSRGSHGPQSSFFPAVPASARSNFFAFVLLGFTELSTKRAACDEATEAPV